MTLLTETECEVQLGLDTENEARAIAERVLDFAGCPWECEVCLTITDSEGIHELNRQFRGIDSPTDVLSFPMNEFDTPGDFAKFDDIDEAFNPDSGELMLGDIVINADRVISQAEEYGHSRRREFCFLIVHSMLHLIGYDHMEDNDRMVMEDLQRKILDDAGITR